MLVREASARPVPSSELTRRPTCFERAAIARTFCVEERQLSVARVRADQREVVLAVDDVHAETIRRDVDGGIAVGDPEGDVVERPRFHVAQGSCLALACDGALQLLLRHAGAALDARAASPRCRAAPSCAPWAGSSRSGGRPGGRTRCRASTSATPSSPRLYAPAPCSRWPRRSASRASSTRRAPPRSP